MATGTEKTRTVLGMIYCFLKSESFRRILFLEVVNENFNRVVLEKIAKDLNPEGLEKTLVYSVDDKHVDLIVWILKEIFTQHGVSNDAIMKITGSIGDKKHVMDAIRRFKNERFKYRRER